MPIEKSRLKPGSHIPQTYQRSSRRLQLTTFSYLSQRIPGASAMDRRRAQICSKCKSNCAIFNYFTSKYGSNRLAGVRCDPNGMMFTLSTCIFIADNRRLACEVDLSSALQASRRSMPGVDNRVGEKCSHTPQRCPRYVGGI